MENKECLVNCKLQLVIYLAGFFHRKWKHPLQEVELIFVGSLSAVSIFGDTRSHQMKEGCVKVCYR